jgi:hypothetical protein
MIERRLEPDRDWYMKQEGHCVVLAQESGSSLALLEEGNSKTEGMFYDH